MKVIEANIYLLSIPFRFSFGHFLKKHSFSDSIVVEVISETGLRGYGEGIARSFVTGETANKSVKHIKDILLPAILHRDISNLAFDQDPFKILSAINRLLPNKKDPGIIAWNASRSAVELALIDCILRNHSNSLNYILPAKSKIITYSGVITSGNLERTVEFARRFKDFGLKYIKIKIGRSDDHKRIGTVREIMGPSVSIRLDANGAYTRKEAIEFIKAVEEFGIDSIEQPVKRGNIKDLAEIKNNTSVPVMVDESLVTLNDANRLIEHSACDYFNLRISKCGGLYNTLVIADLARKNGIKIQLGCQVGETAILSATGRQMASYLSDVRFVEGSFSTLLLVEDISREKITFGKGGDAPLLSGNGLGVEIQEELLKKYARKIINIQ